MPQMADITVKNAAGTDVIYNAATPSAGDKLSAVWTQNALTGIQGFRPRFELKTSSNSSGDVRRADYTLTYPVTYTDSTTGLTRSLGFVKVVGTVFLPAALTTDQWNEAFVQAGNLLAASLIRSSVKDGFAPT